MEDILLIGGTNGTAADLNKLNRTSQSKRKRQKYSRRVAACRKKQKLLVSDDHETLHNAIKIDDTCVSVSIEKNLNSDMTYIDQIFFLEFVTTVMFGGQLAG